MPILRRLITEQDFQEAVDRRLLVRVFRDNHLIESGSTMIRFTADTIITQSSVSDLSYHSIRDCQFFEIKK
ncbi:hypothetical protein [Paenibacillus segetis]|uniref:Uncharacterized protein n=1 Tax=Paenibacillus segetis TaxID=1325360 RepID=A0ABQ1Y1E8_9BACL|nr:hypothetical protein [Paenibacillus segetis]GGH09629.1 hypothetical protein GCM10008013_00760 [Paenibacillus segetis]